MGRRNKGRAIHGMLMLNKGLEVSSNDALQRVKRLYKAAKAGHTGALDPLATGMLPICLGEATKFSQFLLDADKTYEVVATFGVRTTTSDADGEVVAEADVDLSEEQLNQLIDEFKGPSKQVPSMYSALKHNGKPLYWYARQGITVERPARDINIFVLELLSFDGTNAHMRVHCSKGTYIRTLVDDMGQAAGCGAYVSKLHRVAVSQYSAEPMYTLTELEAMQSSDEGDFSALDQLLLPMEAAAMDLPAMDVDFALGDRFLHGQSVPCSIAAELGQFVRIYQQCEEGEKRFIGVGEHIEKARDQSPQLFDRYTFVRPKRLVVFN
ncbi:tRNA pseudouridine(55) synthase TruB [Alteromonas sp. ASW11-36]|uniref:tRNA pseudouridine synthase B n=1 Tax=Alteromonas arenosi TaxID=3055817 RepID=A0ABT7SX11_9ALTE|nr:tRNA pseudouridine(55) synthase TruB [Alteromonas sp. ASW11-36]MDM7860539.1 tRNA pseudouridine(55) synthase TruB [Alteromonas sp. ASW11-36]